MILLIDNYDSFSYNLFQLVGGIEPDIRVIRNDALSVRGIEALAPQGIILSPGPGRPEDAGVCVDVVRELGPRFPILGVCLGHQAICLAYGATIGYAQRLMHGKQSIAAIADEAQNTGLFAGLGGSIAVARYHSLAADETTLPAELVVTARSDDGEVMAVQNTQHPVYGVQFHPESILTPEGPTMLRNFIEQTKR